MSPFQALGHPEMSDALASSDRLSCRYGVSSDKKSYPKKSELRSDKQRFILHPDAFKEP